MTATPTPKASPGEVTKLLKAWGEGDAERPGPEEAARPLPHAPPVECAV